MIFLLISHQKPWLSPKNVLLSSLKPSDREGFNEDNNTFFVAKYRK